MLHNVLITGASGYLGGSLLSQIHSKGVTSYGKLYALVRTDAQADAVKQYNALPLVFDTNDEVAVRNNVVNHDITVIFFLIDALHSNAQINFIKALSEVKQRTGIQVHLLHTSGAKIFSSHSGAPTAPSFVDNAPDLFNIQKTQHSPYEAMIEATNANSTVIEQAEKYGVRSYIFIPCIVYGKGGGFGKVISIQTVAIIKAAKALGRVYKVDSERPTWPVCHISDNTSLYLRILERILSNEPVDHGRNGYYLASSGNVAWEDIYHAMAESLAKRSIIKDSRVLLADDEALNKMATALGCPKSFVQVQLGGLCTLRAKHGEEIGWIPQFQPEHILEAADDEVELILSKL